MRIGIIGATLVRMLRARPLLKAVTELAIPCRIATLDA
ncbi:hypothetical protein MES5069_1590003 [Mesorhizobium escarrei]|uniref:Gfo/Idh/MocA family oxidoreductase n=1 Tax=Mesorhizobium escarrei TaxID=666018 RepID=A0ABN8JFP0_9HYPH|nr:hypothetical protein MES5069_1590003 [Mesorhizobium escarrei]